LNSRSSSSTFLMPEAAESLTPGYIAVPAAWSPATTSSPKKPVY
jgi:hypothetical protein